MGRSARPGSAGVRCPSASTSSPLTSTWSTPCGGLPAVVVRRAVADAVGVEDDDVRRHPGADQPAVAEAEPPRGMGRQVLHGLLQGPGARLADVVAEVAAEAAAAARVRPACR